MRPYWGVSGSPMTLSPDYRRAPRASSLDALMDFQTPSRHDIDQPHLELDCTCCTCTTSPSGLKYHHPRVGASIEMASFFDIKARKAAAATNSSASNKQEKQSDGRLQPWVEK